MIGHSLVRMEFRMQKFTPHCVCRPGSILRTSPITKIVQVRPANTMRQALCSPMLLVVLLCCSSVMVCCSSGMICPFVPQQNLPLCCCVSCARPNVPLSAGVSYCHPHSVPNHAACPMCTQSRRHRHLHRLNFCSISPCWQCQNRTSRPFFFSKWRKICKVLGPKHVSNPE